MLRRALWVALAVLPGCSCDGAGGAADAAIREDGGARVDGAAGPDAALPLIWIDFAITGCAGADQTCRGPAPLALGFVPIAPAPVDVYEWRFEGDGSEPDSRPAPDHVFALPGVYDVSLNAEGPGGTANAIKEGIVVVEPAPIGAPCEGDVQCASGTCVCGGGCADLAAGFCSAPCAGGCESGVCADLGPTAPGAPEPWQAPLCLPDCSGGAACPAGTVCSELRAGGGEGWVIACAPPGPLAALGASCARPSGALDDELCASGTCLAEGLRGLCAAACGPGACPPSAACATFEGGAPGPTCLARCDGDTACDADPWLACQAPGGTGAKAFEVDEPVSPGGYCAPKACSSDPECPQGRCNAGFCGP